MKKLWLIAILLMVLSLNLFADDVTIGAGTSTGYYPFNAWYGFGRSAALYTAEEIGTTGEITHLSWDVSTAGAASLPIKIYAKMVTIETLTAANWATLTDGATLLYDDNKVFSPTGWATIDITDFNYTGDNLLILCEANYGGDGAGYSNYPSFRATSATDKHLVAQSDNNPPTANLTTNANRPNIKITFPSTTPPNAAVIGAPANNATNVTIYPTLSWSAGTGGTPTGYKIYIGTTNPPTTMVADVEDTFYVPTTALAYETEHFWKVVPHNAFGDATDCPVWSFTTRLDPTRPIPYTQDFNAATTWPTDWVNTGMSIAASHGNGGNGVYKNLWSSSASGSFASCPIGPLAAVSEIKFDYRYMAYTYTGYPGAAHTLAAGDKIEVQISTNDGQTYETIHTIDMDNHTTSNQFATPTVPVIGYEGQIVRVRFLATRGAGDYFVDFDNIIVRETPASPVFAINPEEKDFGVAYMPAGSAPQTFTISNDGLGTLVVNSVAIGGADASEFELTDTNTYPVSLLTNETITVQVKLNPTSAGEKIAALNIAYNDGSAGTFAAPLTGNAVNPIITTFPYTDSFELNNTHASTNVFCWTQESVAGSTPWTIYSTDTTPYNRTPRTGNYSATLRYSNTAWLFRPAQLVAGTSYSIEVYGRQDGAVPTNASLTLKYGDSPTAEAMTGSIVDLTPVVNGDFQRLRGAFIPETSGYYFIGILGTINGSPWYITIDDFMIEETPTTPVFAINPIEKDFAGIGMGQSSTDQTFTITNIGIGTLVINSATITGENAGQFVLTDTNEYPIELEEDETATVKVKFSPTLEGDLAANLTFDYNDGTDQTANVALTGNGINPIIHNFPHVETFDTFPPLFWTRWTGLLGETSTLTSTTSGWVSNTWFANTTNHENGKATKLNNYGTSRYYWLITPTIDLGDNVPGGYKLEFDLALTKYNNTNPPALDGIDDKFAVIISTDNGETWSSLNALRLWDNAGSDYVYNEISLTGERITINLIGYSGEVKIGFYGESTVYNADNDIHLDNVTITYDATLPVELSAFNTAVLTNNTVSLSWTTQSENNLFGYHLHRSTEERLNSAERITSALISPTNTSNEANYSYVDSEVLPETTYYYWLQTVESNGTSQFFGPYSVRTNEGNIVPELPAFTSLQSVYPNPFTANSNANFGVDVKEGETAQFVIYNIKGQVVKTYKNINPGKHNLVWDGKDNYKKNCAAGIYFYKLSSPSFSQTKKMMYIK